MHLPAQRAGHDPTCPLAEQDAGTSNAKTSEIPGRRIYGTGQRSSFNRKREKGNSRILRRKCALRRRLSFRVLRSRLKTEALSAVK